MKNDWHKIPSKTYSSIVLRYDNSSVFIKCHISIRKKVFAKMTSIITNIYLELNE